jgi:beta-glucosidase
MNFKIKNLVILLSLFSFEIAVSQSVPMLRSDNIREVIQAMTLDEKVNMVLGVGDEGVWRHYKTQGKIVLKGQACAMYSIPRLGIPHIVLTDGPAGLRIDTIQDGVDHPTYATAFPSATALASTWNKDLVQKVGEAMGNEVLEYGSDVLLGPGMNIQRNPLTGRNFEYYSEDPLVSGEMAAAMVNGIQKYNVGACMKHFAANNIETNRRTINAVISQRALREIYLRGYQIALRKSDPWMIMTSYNKINGYYTPEDKALLQDIVRDEWNYKGVMVTDWVAGKDFIAQMRAGNELLMPGNYQTTLFKQAVNRGILDESVFDRNIEKILEFIVKTPTFNQYQKSNKPNLAANAKQSQVAAEEGMILLDNKNNALPLKKAKNYALFGKTSYNFIAGGTGSGRVNYKHAVSLTEGLENAKFKIDKPLRAYYTQFIDSVMKVTKPTLRVREKNIIDFAEEPVISKALIQNSVKKNDVAIITIGRNAGELWDRSVDGYFLLTDAEMNMIKDVSEIYQNAGKKVIVILNIGGPIDVANWRHIPDAILLAWQTGQEGGNALVNILTGKVNPSGKLAVTFPMKYEDVPSSNSFPGVPKDNPVNAYYEEGIYVGYRFHETFNVKPAYEFGYGLSYTNFTYTDLKLNQQNFDGSIEVSVTIKNTGKIAGKEAVQLYLKAPETKLEKPALELKEFGKTKLLKPGEGETLTMILDANSLASFWPGKSQWIAEKGDYQVCIGASSRDIRLTGQFTLPEDIMVEQVNDVMYPNFYFLELTKREPHKNIKTSDIIIPDDDN